MFEHLDDDRPPTLDAAFRNGVRRRARSMRRRRRLVALAGASVPVTIGGTAVYLRAQLGEVQRIDIRGADGSSPSSAALPDDSARTAVSTTASPAAPSTAAAAALKQPMTILIVGTDARALGDPIADQSPVPGNVQRADTIMLVRIDPVVRRTAVLSLPRDLWVRIDGGALGKLSATVEGGNVRRLVDTLYTEFGVSVDHYVGIDFRGFVRLIDLAGGVTVKFDQPVQDRNTGLDIRVPGCVELDGRAALQYSRSRFLRVLDPVTGRYRDDPAGDLGRVARQQDLVARVARSILTADYGLADTYRLITDVFDDLTVDREFSLADMRSMFATARSIGTGRMALYNLSSATSAGVVGNSPVLKFDRGEASKIVQAFLDTRPDGPGTAIPEGAVVPQGDCA